MSGRGHDYHRFQEHLPVLRGKFLFGQHIAQNAARRSRFYCQYDEFTADTALNRVLKASCEVLLTQVRTRNAEDGLRRCLVLLDGVASMQHPTVALERVYITRKNARFAQVFAFARMVLQGFTTHLATGEQHVFSLLFDMNRIFEEFVGRLGSRAAANRSRYLRYVPEHESGMRRIILW